MKPGRMRDRALKRQLAARYAPKKVLKYSQVVRTLIGPIDGKAGVVHDVDAGRDVKAEDVGFGSRVTLNAEHTRPKSHGVADTPAVSDFHHLFPVDSEANQKRANLPFGEVEAATWSKGGAKLGLDANGNEVFEPPDEHKGNAARALLLSRRASRPGGPGAAPRRRRSLSPSGAATRTSS